MHKITRVKINFKRVITSQLGDARLRESPYDNTEDDIADPHPMRRPNLVIEAIGLASIGKLAASPALPAATAELRAGRKETFSAPSSGL
jgi:hypothetical protein